jgi:hypothetical protein
MYRTFCIIKPESNNSITVITLYFTIHMQVLKYVLDCCFYFEFVT